MDDDKVKAFGKNRVNWKILALIAFVILVGIGIAAIQEYNKYISKKPILIDSQSEKGKRLTDIAEKTLENEGIDTRYLHLGGIFDYSSNNTLLQFGGTSTYYNAKIYTNHNLTEKETSAVLADDLSRVISYSTRSIVVKIHDKNIQIESEIWEYGKNYSVNISNNILEVIDIRSNKVKLKILNYSVNNVIQDEEQTGAIVNEINRKFEEVSQNTNIKFHIDKEEPVVIIIIDNSKFMYSPHVDVALCDSQPCSIHIEERPEEIEGKNGWFENKIITRIKYFNAS